MYTQIMVLCFCRATDTSSIDVDGFCVIYYANNSLAMDGWMEVPVGDFEDVIKLEY